MGNGLSQFYKLGFQETVRNDLGANGRAQIAAANGDRLVDGGLKSIVRFVRPGNRGHGLASGLTVESSCSYFVLMESSRRFKPPWTLVRENSECYVVRDANGVTLAWLYCRDDAQRYSFGVGKLSSDEARRIGKAIARIPEFLMPRQGFYPRGGGPRWRADRPYHVALEDRYIREHWDEIDAVCKLNSLPCNATGEAIQNEGVWRVYEFTWQMDAILFWNRFEGRWLRGTEFHYPERPENLPSLKPLENWRTPNPRDLR
ncbi:hypothetical protein [Bradyrhizobium ivorense]|uniref:hypothetical protein n=1 Tax=Bradyrhizobium ivorense TaxID=2511166 RepID=UPI0027E2C533|nr:hypothetical protein [Bradyrhizobium ivorense]